MPAGPRKLASGARPGPLWPAMTDLPFRLPAALAVRCAFARTRDEGGTGWVRLGEGGGR